jgi:hypothetical protein
MRNYVTKLRYEGTLRNYITKYLRKTKQNRNYVTYWRIRNQEVKIGVYIVENTFDGCFCSFIQLKLRVITLRFVSENGYYA